MTANITTPDDGRFCRRFVGVVIAVVAMFIAGAASAQIAGAPTGRNAGLTGIDDARKAWTTPLATRLGVDLERVFDSRGPDAWDPKAHPLVFITTEGPGYGGLLSGLRLPGVVIYDANTRKVVASATYDTLSWGYGNVFEPHGLGVSPDGQWIYLPTGEGSFGSRGVGRLLIINARTLKVDKVLRLTGQPHHAKALTLPDGKQLAYAYGWAQPLFVMDPKDGNKVVGGLDFNDMGIEGYLYFASPDGDQIIATGRIRDGGVRAEIGDNVLVRISTKDWKPFAYAAVHDGDPVWVSFAADGKYAYVSGASNSRVFRLDLATGKINAAAHSGVEGPYGVHLSWDDKTLYTIGKGEESHNRGKVVGIVPVDRMGDSDKPSEQIVTDCVRGDHGTIHPDPEAEEMWITCNSSFEVVIFDMARNKVTARLPTPNGGSTHSGSFVAYDGWNGEVVSDQNGLQGSALALKRELLGIVRGELGRPSSPAGSSH